MNAELGSKKWLFAGIGLQFGVGYSLGFLVYFFGTLITGAKFGALWISVLGWALVLIFAAVIAVMIIKRNRQLAAECGTARCGSQVSINV